MIHIPVLLKEVLGVLKPRDGEFIVDGTIGGGGHSVEIFKKILPKGKLLGIDLDENNLETARLKISTEIKNKKLKIKNNLILMNANYADLPEILKENNLPKADGLLLDLGFSSAQLEKSGRGFSFLRNEILDMRYELKKGGLTAAEIINSLSEKELADVIFKYGEEGFARKIAKKIIEERKQKRILTTFDLVNAVKKTVFGNKLPLAITRTFQAVRIYVNKELENLESILKNLQKIVKPKGRVAIISFHSLEDRLVKNCFKKLAKEGKAEILTKKPIRPSEGEIKRNPRSRSAKLRAITTK